jgi:hypothetical protein
MDPFPEHPGFVTIRTNGVAKVVPASEVPDRLRFLYTPDGYGNPTSRVPVLEIEYHYMDEQGNTVPKDKACTGLMVSIGENGVFLQSVQLSLGCLRH